MTFTAKTRQAKRKLETKEDKNTASESSGKTIDIVSDDRDLTQELNDALLEEVKNNEKAIANLERKEKKHLEDIKQLKLKLEKNKTQVENDRLGNNLDNLVAAIIEVK